MGEETDEMRGKALAAKMYIFLPKTRRRILELLCRELCDGSYKSGETNIRDITRLRFKLRTFAEISREAGLSHVTVRRIAKELQEVGLVEVQYVGKANVVIPTEEMLELCKRLRGELEILGEDAV